MRGNRAVAGDRFRNQDAPRPDDSYGDNGIAPIRGGRRRSAPSPSPKPRSGAEPVAAHDRSVHSDRADDCRGSLRPHVRHRAPGRRRRGAPGQSPAPMAPRDIPSWHGENFLYDFKGGSLRSPPGPARGLRALASSRPRPRWRPPVQPPTLQLVAIGITGRRQGKHGRSAAVAAVHVHAHSGRDTLHLTPCPRRAGPGRCAQPPARRRPRSAWLLLLDVAVGKQSNGCGSPGGTSC